MTSKENSNRQIIHFSANSINSFDDLGFCAEEYSKFKHGAVNIARKFGYELVDKFIENCFAKNYNGNQILILPSAYSHIPTASYYLTRFFIQKLNDYLRSIDAPVTEEAKIYRSVSYREDYGEMLAEQRFNLIKNDRFYIDNHLVKDKIVLHLDDVKITGTHERIILNALEQNDLKNDCYMLYFAELCNTELPPNIENYLNHKFVKNLNDIDFIIKNEDFCFNTRVVKYIIGSEKAEFEDFIQKQTENFIKDLYYNAIGNEYFKFNEY